MDYHDELLDSEDELRDAALDEKRARQITPEGIDPGARECPDCDGAGCEHCGDGTI